MVWPNRNKDDASTVSLEGSPNTCSSTGDTATICSETTSTSTADIDDNATFKVSCDTTRTSRTKPTGCRCWC